ncbi:glycerate kinase [Chloroflexota bacterium]
MTPIIKNLDSLATTQSRRQVLEIIEAGISRVLPQNIMRSAVKYDTAGRVITINNDAFDLSGGRLFVIGGGKASGRMAQALEEIVGVENIADGAVNCKGGQPGTRKIRVKTAGHPVPDERGISGVEDMLALKGRYLIGKNDLVISLISGGGSALLPYPVEGVSLGDKQIITELLIGCGAEIDEINTVRKHLSRIKGGQLASFFHPATVISLIISDVIGNDLAVIASCPTVADPSTFSDARQVLERYHLTEKAPKSVIEFLNKGCRGEMPETPKTLDNCHNYIIGDNSLAMEAMQGKAREMGFSPHIITVEQKGGTTEIAQSRAKEIRDGKYAEYDILLIGGETTVKLPPDAGRGGRNQHYAAASLLAMAEYPGEWTVASVGTDGSDFLPDVAGAIVDRSSLETVRTRNIDVESYLERCDSYTLLESIGSSLIVTGDTGTNVGDLLIYLKKDRA